MKLLFTLICLFILNGQETKWTADKSHSAVTFTVTHLLISEVSGQFNSFDGSITSNGDDFDGAKAEMTIESSSVFTNQNNRDNDLRSEKFFDVEKYPTIKFESTSFKKTGENMFKITGNLTMKDVTKEISLDAKILGVAERRGKKVAGIKITGTLSRKEFHVGTDFPTAAVSDEIELKINSELKMN
ncbi:MAG: YceI family protein [Calditrichaeota bacterium]|nr:YceI family protein [Calditrichota bacterium]